MLSLQASYAAPLILLAQNRQDDRDRVQIEQDRQRAERNLADTEYLAREIVALRLRRCATWRTKDFIRAELRAAARGARRRRDANATRATAPRPMTDASPDAVRRARRRGHRPGDPPADHRARHGRATSRSTDGVAARRHQADDRRLPGRRPHRARRARGRGMPSPGVDARRARRRRHDARRARARSPRAARRARRARMPFGPDSLTRVIAVTSGKGGVGKSTVTANLAVALAARGLSVGHRRRRRARLLDPGAARPRRRDGGAPQPTRSTT